MSAPRDAASPPTGSPRERSATTAVALARLRHGLPPPQARRYDDLPAETLGRFEHAHVTAADPAALWVAVAERLAALR